jgi:hypothetical protein
VTEDAGSISVLELELGVALLSLSAFEWVQALK